MKYLLAALVLTLLVAGGVCAYFLASSKNPAAPALLAVEVDSTEATSEQIHQLCAGCHAYPSPLAFPRREWRREVKQAFDFIRASDTSLDGPSLESVVRYYEKRAPEELPRPDHGPIPLVGPATALETVGIAGPEPLPLNVTNVRLASLFDSKKRDLLLCTKDPGEIWAVKAYETPPSWHRLGEALAPAHVEVVDLDGDGHKDLLVADLGNFGASDDRTGSVIWMRNDGKGKFTPITLLEGVGRIADVQAADFRGVGKLDLVVAVFGWRNNGAVLYLENQTTDWNHPKFIRKVLDNRPGAIHVPVGDIDGDGKPDIVAVISQGTEAVVAFLNKGGTFKKETIYEAPHPAFGSSGIQLVDLNGDGKLDVLYTHGDTLDAPYLLKPYHGVHWLENRGTFPFVPHHLTAMYGVMRAEAVDLQGNGRLDVLAVGFLPMGRFSESQRSIADSVLLLEQARPGQFTRHVLETGQSNHVSCAVGDVFGDGKNHLVVGNFFLTRGQGRGDTLTIHRNLGRR
jgi:FG-GAP-like repeat